ncbi:uncharacterized protein [Littorina saxatilis]|uniref:Uncharacterized protein n=1 Tax=Littorina saxatilis TaxID=31220 RepID=A0AAN9GI41_9CAEN
MGKARPASSRLRFVPPFTPHIDSQQPASSDKTSPNCYDQVPGDDLVDSSQATWPEATSDQTGDHGNARRKAVKACRTAGAVLGAVLSVTTRVATSPSCEPCSGSTQKLPPFAYVSSFFTQTVTNKAKGIALRPQSVTS